MRELLLYSGFWGDPNDPMTKGGQISYPTPGTYDWIVPDKVTEISVLIISAGQQGRVQTVAAANAGASGGVRWKNKIAVVPGETYRIIVGNGGVQKTVPYGTASSHQLDYPSSAFGINVGINAAESTPIGTDMGGGNGTGGASGNSEGQMFLGGNAPATFISNGGGTPAGRGINTLGVVTNALSPNGGLHGGGGAAQSRESGVRTCGKGGDGVVKIIWGKGRAFPSSNIADR